MTTVYHSKTPVTNDAKVHAAWKALPELAKRFQFTEANMLVLMGDMPRATYRKGVQLHTTRLNRDQLDRVSYLLGIMKALRILYVDSLQAYGWIDRANSLPPFNGMAPRQYLLDGSLRHLSDTRRMLDAWRG
ncbi:antitoxin Xre-like helix-turn-helix domain-containing protein [Reinekea sp.]|uniref:antitoxin Xre-like helix-turn-helix domain-containing protein n=1 Tax=Reinekea sp. TaxID=1970455 RepID=UPI002A8216A9|nr:antitoxin Xre-like helix-turn-helix domain-containing protein [Reinekea sp.]